MINVNEILSSVTATLDITRQSAHTFSKDMFLRVLDDGLIKLARKYPVLQKTDAFTTTAGQTVYTLDTTVRPFNVLDVYTDWPYPVRRLQPQEIRDFKQQAENSWVQFPYEAHASQPTYWAFHPNLSSGQMGDIESPGVCVEIQEGSKVAAGKTVRIRYSYVPRLTTLNDKTATIDVGEEYSLFLKTYVAWMLSKRYRPDLTQVLAQDFQLEIVELQADHRRRMQSSENDHTHRLLF